MKDVVIVFARAPRLGTVKRRLARGIGARAALRFHTATLERLARALRRDRRFESWLAVTPDGARGRFGAGLPRLPQGRGDLEQRMTRAFNRFPRRRTAIVGCDIPDLTPTDVALAFRALGGADAVFGPASDGGYWLAAMGVRRPHAPFARVRWSGPHALADTVGNFAGRRVAMLRELSDVDDTDDFSRLSCRGHIDVMRQHGSLSPTFVPITGGRQRPDDFRRFRPLPVSTRRKVP